MKHKAPALVAVLVLAGTLTACGQAPTGQETTSEVKEKSDEYWAQAEEPEEVTNRFMFGETGTFDNGFAVTVDKADDAKVSEYAASDCAPGDPIEVYTLSVENGTDTVWHGSMVSGLSMVYQDESGIDVQASDVFDSDLGLSAGLDFPDVRPGSSASQKYGFCVTGAADDPRTVIEADVYDMEEEETHSYEVAYFSETGEESL